MDRTTVITICIVLASLGAVVALFGFTVFVNASWNRGGTLEGIGVVTLIVVGFGGFGMACAGRTYSTTNEDITDQVEILKGESMVIVIHDGEVHEYSEHSDYVAIDSTTKFFLTTEYDAYGFEFDNKKFYYSNE